jgi:hypothetical protein
VAFDEAAELARRALEAGRVAFDEAAELASGG